MASLRWNVVANLFGKIWIAIVSMAFVPLYIRQMGIESYALVAFYGSMATVLSVLDIGLLATIDREIARLPAEAAAEAALATRNLVRTFELLFVGLGVFVGALAFALAPVIAGQWLHASELPQYVVVSSIRAMGAIFACQWPFSIYIGGLLGLQRQIQANVINVVSSTVKFGGAGVIVVWVSQSIEVFFLWQFIATLLQTVVARYSLLRALPHRELRGSFDARTLYQNWRFSLGMSVVSILGVAVIQSDRVAMSRCLSLEDFGFYGVANTVGRSLSYLMVPVFTAVYPRLCQLVAARDDRGVRSLYHVGSQIMAVAILPVSAVLGGFSREVLFAWTTDVVVADRTHLVVAIITAGSAIQALMQFPFGLQVAEGWTSLSIWSNAVAVSLLVPTLVMVAPSYGMVGGATCWLAYCACTMATGVPLMHRRLLRGELWRWCADSVAKPLVASLGVVLFARAEWPVGLSRVESIVALLLLGGTATVAAALAAPMIRHRLIAICQRGYERRSA